MNERFPQLFWGLVILSLGLVAIGGFTYSAIRAAKRGNDVITVTGSARRTVKSDYVTWSGSYYANEMTMQKAYEVISRHNARVREYLKSRRVPDSLVVFSSINTRDMMKQKRSAKGDMEEEFIGYQATQRFDIRSSKVMLVDSIARDIGQLALEGLPIRSDPPQFFYSKLADMRVELLGEATKDAKARAEQMASSGGGKIGPIRNARAGVFQITAPNSREVSDYGMYDTSTIDKDITSVVTVTFAVE